MKKINKKFFIILFIVTSLFFFVNKSFYEKSILYANSSSELENDELKVTIDKDTGFFNIYSKKYKVYLLFPSKPLTSIVLIKYDTTLIQLDKITAQKREVFLENDTLTYNFELSYLSFIERIKFVKIDELNIGLEVEFEIINKDKRGHYITLGLIIDTYLGESSFTPFRVSNVGLIDKAKVYEKNSIPDIIYSLDNPKDPLYGLLFYFRKAGYTVPEKVFLSSYDDMAINLFDYKGFSPLSFDSKYKKGDAAVGVLYSEKYIEKGQSLKNLLLLGFYPVKSTEKKSEDVEKSSEYLTKYIEEQILILNKKINDLKDTINKISSKIKDIKKMDEILIKINEVYSLILTLENNIEFYTLEDFKKKVNDINELLKVIEENIKNLLNQE